MLALPGAGPERVFNALHNGIEYMALVGGIHKRKAIDEPAAATEHHFLIENLPVALTGQYKPIAPPRAVVDLIIGVGPARDKFLIRGRRLPIAVGQGSNKQPRVNATRDEHHAVSRLGSPLNLENVSGIAQAEPETLVAIRLPTRARACLLRRSRRERA